MRLTSLLGLLLWLTTSPLQALDSGEYSPAELISQLQQGGLVIYLRHAATDHTQHDTSPNDCARQRRLSAAGREQAKEIGWAMRARGIPIGEVFSSPYCRCTETAQLAFGRYNPQAHLAYSLTTPPKQLQADMQKLQAQLSSPTISGHNRVLVSHSGNLKDATGIWPKPEASAFIFEPLGGERFQYLGRLTVRQWQP